MKQYVYVPFDTAMQDSNKYNQVFAEQNHNWQLVKQLYDKHYIRGIARSNIRIPRIIHQIWLGSRFPNKYLVWQKTWKDIHPDWEYYLWTDNNIESLKLINKQAFCQSKNLGTKSDILRYEILYQYGGLYVDTDFECLKSLEPLHHLCDLYTGVAYSKEACLANGLIGSIPRHPILRKTIDNVRTSCTQDDADELMKKTGPYLFTRYFLENSEKDNLINIAFPVSFFYPFPNDMRHIRNKNIAREYLRKESFAIHYWEVSWLRTSFFRIIRNVMKQYAMSVNV